MPRYTPSEDELDSSYGSSKAAPVTPPDEGAKPEESVDEENAGQETALVSNKILSPEGESLKPGDEIVLQVVKNYGDECEVKYAPHKSDEAASEPETSGAAEDFAAMDTEKA